MLSLNPNFAPISLIDTGARSLLLGCALQDELNCRYRTPLAAAILGLLLRVSLDAATLTVTSSGDAGGACFPGGTCTLRQAITTSSPGDTINFAPGISTIILTGGELSIRNSLTINGPGANLLTVQRSTASGTPPFRIFSIDSLGDVTISGLTITNGNVTFFPVFDDGGGGILNNGSGTLTVTDCTISGNVSEPNGGGILSRGTMLKINNSTISGNSTTPGSGGGIALSAGYVTNTAGALVITNSTISGNSGGSCGGVLGSGSVTITSSTSLWQHSQRRRRRFLPRGQWGSVRRAGDYFQQHYLRQLR